MHTEYTTDRPSGQALTPVDIGDGKPLGYWVKDEQGRVYHTYTEDELPLCDRSPSGKVRPWRARHRAGLMLAEIYNAMGETGAPGAAGWLSKAQRLESCAQYVEFARAAEGQLTLHNSSFCRVRLCPMCQWRRSLKLGAQVRQVVERANAEHIAQTGAAWRWLMVTYTIRNVEGVDLSAAIDRIHHGLNNMAKAKLWRGAVKGWLRATEVTHNTNERSAAYDTYHPHMHLLLCVPAGYMSGKGYITQRGWAQLWQHYIGTDYTPVVDVRAIKPEGGGRLPDLPVEEQAAAMGKACAEVSKYAAKPADYIIPSDLALSMSTVQVLDMALNRRRMTSWGGILKDIAKQLQLDDPESGDLIHIDESTSADQTAEQLGNYVAYNWALGAGDYLKIGQRQGQTPAAERAQHAADRRAVKVGRTAAQQREDAADWWTVDTYLDANSWDKRVRAAAVDDLRTLPRATIEQRLQSIVGDLPEGWDNET